MKLALYPKFLICCLFEKGKDRFFSAGYELLYPEYSRCGLLPWQHYVIYGRRKGYNDGNKPSDDVFFREGYELEYPDVVASGYDAWHHYAETGKAEGRDNGLHPNSQQFFAEGYIEMYPYVAKISTDPWHHYVLIGRKDGRDNGLHPDENQFFAAGYLEMNPDVPEAAENPWHHYVMHGKAEGRDNGLHPTDEQFFPEGYLEMYPDVVKTGMDPWHHYVMYGKAEGRDNGLHPTDEQFFPEGYLEMYPDVAKTGMDPWHHYVRHGKAEGRDNGLHPTDEQFFPEGYLEMYPDVAATGEDPWHHYVLFGKAEDRDNGNHPCSAEFVPQIYLMLNPDLRNSVSDLWLHYARYGKIEKRAKSLYPFFDEIWYLSHYPQIKNDPDIKSGAVSPEAHYFFKGWKLGYDPSLNFDTKYYIKKYRDIRERQICPLAHYVARGRFENRQPYNPHDLNEVRTLTELPEPYESGFKPKACKSVNLGDLEDNALLIMLAEHLGDIVANEPVARYLKWRFSERPVYWVVESRFSDIVRYNPFIDGYVEVDSLKECIEKIVNLFFDGRPDCVDHPKYYWHAKENGIGFRNFYANDCLLSSMSQAAGLDRLMLAPRFWEKPEYSRLSKEEVWEKLGLSEAVDKIAHDHGSCRVILLHTKSNDPRRDWTDEKFTELTDKMLGKYPAIVIAELGMTPVVNLKDARFVTLETIKDLQFIYQVIKNAELIIGIDSSFMHMANASGTKAVSIMGRLDQFSHHCPYSGRFWDGNGITFVRAGEGDESPAVEISDVMKAVDRMLA